MSSPSRKVSLRKRLSIAARSVAIGGAVAAVTPYLLYRGYLSDAKSGKKPVSYVDWQRIVQVVKDSNVMENVAAELMSMSMSVGSENDLGGGDYADEPTFH